MRMTSAALVAACLTVTLTGCAKAAADTTCDEFAAMDLNKRTSTVNRMIRDKGLDPNSNILGAVNLANDVASFCGLPTLANAGVQGARQNNNQPISHGVNWAEYGA